MGKMLVQELIERKVPVVVIEKVTERTREVEDLGQLYIVGDATEEDTLLHAGIKRAHSLVAALPDDANNVFVTLTAREMSSDLHIVARAEQLSAGGKLRRAGANRVISTQAIGAERIANILTRPHVVDFVDMAAKGVELEMDQFLVTSESPISGKPLKEAKLREIAELMVVAIRGKDGTTRFNPGEEAVLHPDDTLILIGPTGAANRLKEMHVVADAPLASD